MKRVAALSLAVQFAPALVLAGPPGLLENTKMRDGEESLLMMGQYQFKLKVQVL